MLRKLMAAAILFCPLPASGELPVPTPFGDWQLVCTSGIHSSRSCSITLRTSSIEHYRNQLSETGLTVSVDLDGGNYYRVQSFGSNGVTCGKIAMDEEMQLGPRPRDEQYFDQFVARLQKRIVETMRSHLKLIGNCSPMGVPRGGFPPQLFDGSLPDLNVAISTMAERVRGHRPGAHRPLRSANP